MDAHARRSPMFAWLVGAASENLGLKVTSLLIAIALFAMVRGAGSVQRPLEVTLLDRLPPASLHRVLLTELPDSVRVTVRGPPSLVGNLRADGLGPVIADLSDGRRRELRVDPASLRLPSGVQLVQIEPRTIELAWDDLVQRDVPVRADIVGAPAPGFQIQGPVEVTPPTVHVSGPALYVEPMSVIHTVPVDVTGLAAGHYPRRVPLEPAGHRMHFDAPDGVRVSFAIATEVVERRFERLPVTAVGVGRVELRPAIATVTVQGAPAALNALDPAEIVLTVELPSHPNELRGATRLPLQLAHLPRGVSMVALDPAEVIAIPSH